MDRPLRIAFVIQNLAGLRGGAERVLVTTARGLAERGHEVRILTYDSHLGAPAYDPGPVAVEPVFPGASGRRSQPAGYGRPGRLRQMVKAAPNLPPFGQVKWSLTHGLFARRLRFALARHVPDAVVAFMPPAITATATAIANLPSARRPAFVASIRSQPAADFDDASPRWDQNPVYRRRARQALAQADAITILQPDFAAWFPAELQSRLTVLPNSVQRLSPAQTPAPPREPLILSVGRLAPEKGHAILIDAFARLAPRHPDWRLVILGEGSERASLTARIAAHGLDSRVDLPGISHQVGAVYDRASILCHPARFEGFGLAVSEAMAHGLPAVAFADCPGVNRLIRSCEDGILVPPEGDRAEALAHALAPLLEDEGLRARLGQAATGLADRLAPSRILDLWETLLIQASNRRRLPR